MQILCSGCQKALNVPDSAAGKDVRCPMSQTVFLAPVLMEIEPTLPVAIPVNTETAITTPSPLPAADEPRAARPASSDERRAHDETFDEEDRRERQIGLKQVRVGASLTMGAGWLNGAALYFIFYVFIHFMLTGCVLPGFPLRGQSRGLIALMFAATILSCIPPIFMFIGAAQLRSARSRGLVITAVVFDFIMCAVLVLGIGFRLISLYHANPHEVTIGLAFIQMLMATGGIALGLVAGIKTLFLIRRPGIKEAFDYHRVDAWDDAGDTQWEQQRRQRRRHGGEE